MFITFNFTSFGRGKLHCAGKSFREFVPFCSLDYSPYCLHLLTRWNLWGCIVREWVRMAVADSMPVNKSQVLVLSKRTYLTLRRLQQIIADKATRTSKLNALYELFYVWTLEIGANIVFTETLEDLFLRFLCRCNILYVLSITDHEHRIYLLSASIIWR